MKLVWLGGWILAKFLFCIFVGWDNPMKTRPIVWPPWPNNLIGKDWYFSNGPKWFFFFLEQCGIGDLGWSQRVSQKRGFALSCPHMIILFSLIRHIFFHFKPLDHALSPSPYQKKDVRGKSWVPCVAHFRVSYTKYLVVKLFVGSNSSSIWRRMFVLWSLTYLKAPMEQFMRFLLPRLLSFWPQVCVLKIRSVLPTICSRELFTLVRHFLRFTSFSFCLNLMTCLAGH